MNVTARTEYACLAMMELAGTHGSGQPVRIRAIADLHGIPSRFLVQILLQLKRAGLVHSTRGSSGGYHLARDPTRITLADILEAVDSLPASPPRPTRPRTASARVLSDTWERITDQQRRLLEGITLADLDARVRQQADNMYYI